MNVLMTRIALFVLGRIVSGANDEHSSRRTLRIHHYFRLDALLTSKVIRLYTYKVLPVTWGPMSRDT